MHPKSLTLGAFFNTLCAPRQCFLVTDNTILYRTASCKKLLGKENQSAGRWIETQDLCAFSALTTELIPSALLLLLLLNCQSVKGSKPNAAVGVIHFDLISDGHKIISTISTYLLRIHFVLKKYPSLNCKKCTYSRWLRKGANASSNVLRNIWILSF